MKYKIIICEQYHDNRKFNKGQLTNLGILIAKSQKCSHVLITNVNNKIKPDMIPYYLAFNETEKGGVNIGFSWSDHYQKKYFNDICLWKLDLLLKIGGYPNEIWGWGCADRILYHRYCKYIKTNKLKDGSQWGVFIPILKNKLDKYDLSDWGQIIDPQYQHLKILDDWNIEKYTDLDVLEKYIDEIINLRKKLSKKKNQSKTSLVSSMKKIIKNNNDVSTNNEDSDIIETITDSERFKANLKIVDKYKYQHQKDVEHYTFKLISKLNLL